MIWKHIRSELIFFESKYTTSMVFILDFCCALSAISERPDWAMRTTDVLSGDHIRNINCHHPEQFIEWKLGSASQVSMKLRQQSMRYCFCSGVTKYEIKREHAFIRLIFFFKITATLSLLIFNSCANILRDMWRSFSSSARTRTVLSSITAVAGQPLLSFSNDFLLCLNRLYYV